jgi:peptidoglycan/LPS O-acetylase OafA/YrhL
MVFGFHVLATPMLATGTTGTVMSWVFAQGSAGVSFFFILSGFVLAWSARPGDTAARFWRRRFAKIYPNHFVTFLGAAGILLIKGLGIGLLAATANLLLIQAWFPYEHIYFGMNTPSWSLACEAFFYALFPLVYRGVLALRGRWLWPAALGALALVWLIPALVQPLPEDWHYWLIWIFPVARLPEFVAGMLLARIVRDGRWIGLSLGWATAITVVVYLAARWVPFDARIVAATAVPFALLIAAAGAADVAGKATLWRHRWAVFLGEISYAFYLVHQLVLRVVKFGLGSHQSIPIEVVAAVGALGITVLLSWLLYIWVEQPMMRILKGRNRRPARHAAA